MKKLGTKEMLEIFGGVSAREYCQILGNIMANNDLDKGAKEGAQHGWNKYCA